MPDDRPGAPAPTDPDPADPHAPLRWDVLAVIGAGGVLGALARYAVTVLVPHERGGFDHAIFAVNVVGCLLIGALMVVITEVRAPHRLARPFLGTGLLGGFTTFSTAVAGTRETEPRIAVAYLFGTLACALAAVWAGAGLTRAVARRLGRARTR